MARARLHAARIWIAEVSGQEREAQLPALTLTFEYENTAIRASDRRDRFFVARPSGVQVVERDRQAEVQTQCLLEGFGAVEIDCLPGYSGVLDDTVDYLVSPLGDVHAWCSFSAVAVPKLRAAGVQVEVDSAYPYQVLPGDGGWYAELEARTEDAGWFNLELGIEIQGRRINLLPALLQILEECSEPTSFDQLLLLPVPVRALPAGDGTYVTVPPERLRALLRVMGDLYRGNVGSESIGLPGTRLGLLNELEAAFSGTGASLTRRGRMELFDRARSFAGGATEPPASPPALAATLRPYQAEGVAWLQHLREHGAGGILADDMGLGKTLQTIAHLVIEKEAGRMIRPSLIVVPKSLATNWQRELSRFAPALRVALLSQGTHAQRTRALPACDVVLTTYPLLLKDLEAHLQREYSVLILDEAQIIKNPKGLTHGALKAIQAEQRICLSGTPIENHLGELWALFDFLMPGHLGNREQFSNAYRNPIERGREARALDSLRRSVQPYILRRVKEEVARDLPPKTRIAHPIELQGDQRDLYESIRVAAHDQVRRAIRSKGLAGSAIAILDALMKLRQVCCDPRLLRTASAAEVTGSAKFDTFFELLTDELDRNRRVLVFSQFAQMLRLLKEELADRGIPHSELTGATPDRKNQVDRFQKGAVDVFLISLKAGGTGLNLTRADTVIHYDPWWNAAAQAQATDRAHRIGQTRPVFVHDLLITGSVEERIIRLQQRKTELCRLLLDAPTTAATPVLPPPFSESEVDDLFAPLGD